jgi:hypothetical protein
MAYGNNRAAQQTRASFQTAGGCIIKFRHPFLAGALDLAYTQGNVDEIDVSRSLKLADTFINAQPNQDSSSQVVLVDGSTVVITNHILNGTLTLPLIKTTGKVATGCLVSALQLIVASKDSVGGTLQRTIFINGEAHTRLYYGVSIKKVPHDIIMGLDVPVYQTELFYAGFIDAISASGEINQKAIWAVGSASGVKGTFTPYEVNDKASTGAEPMSMSNALGQGIMVVDDLSEPPNNNVVDEAGEDLTGGAYPYVRNPTQPFVG